MIIGKFNLPIGLFRKYGRQLFSSAKDHNNNEHHDEHHHDVDHHHGHHAKPQRPPVEYNTVSAFLDHQNLTTYFEVGPGYMKYPGVEYHHHHHQSYDWRKDPKINKDIEQDPRDYGVPDVTSYTYPYEGRDSWDTPLTTETNYLYSTSLVLKPENEKIGQIFNLKRIPYWEPESDVNHEYDYESEDYDYQTDNFRTQHFRKTAPLWPYVFVLFMPYIFVSGELLFQHYPDEDHWRLNRTPPLNYPDTEDTDDTDTYDNYKTQEARYLQDLGLIGPLWFDIVDGKKVYNKWAGVNQPMEDI